MNDVEHLLVFGHLNFLKKLLIYSLLGYSSFVGL